MPVLQRLCEEYPDTASHTTHNEVPVVNKTKQNTMDIIQVF